MVRQGANSSFAEALTFAAGCTGVVAGTEDYREATAAFAEEAQARVQGTLGMTDRHTLRPSAIERLA